MVLSEAQKTRDLRLGGSYVPSKGHFGNRRFSEQRVIERSVSRRYADDNREHVRFCCLSFSPGAGVNTGRFEQILKNDIAILVSRSKVTQRRIDQVVSRSDKAILITVEGWNGGDGGTGDGDSDGKKG